MQFNKYLLQNETSTTLFSFSWFLKQEPVLQYKNKQRIFSNDDLQIILYDILNFWRLFEIHRTRKRICRTYQNILYRILRLFTNMIKIYMQYITTYILDRWKLVFINYNHGQILRDKL